MIFKSHLFIFFSCISAILSVPVLCHGATITVSPDGTRDYTTIQAGVNAATGGDIVDVYPGEYDEAVTLDKEIYLRAVKGPVLTKIIGAGTGIAISGTNSRIEGFTVTKAANAISSSVTCFIYNCVLTAQGAHGFYTNTSNIYPSIVNCIFLNCSGSGIYNDYTGHIYVRNSIFYGNQEYAIRAETSYSSKYATATYCCFFENPSGNTAGAVTIGEGCITSDPSFRDTNEFDYRLTESPSSPCIDAGESTAGSRDPDGTRNDMGIFGGPYAASFWYGPQDGPAVRNLQAVPPVVQYGSTFRIQGTAEIR